MQPRQPGPRRQRHDRRRGPGQPNHARRQALTAVQARADLAVTKTSDAATYKPWSVITYTVIVVNNGPSDALRVVVTDELPTVRQTTYLSDTGRCTLRDDTLTCNLGDLPAGTRKSFDISIRVERARGEVTNRASVGSVTVDPDATNNTAIRTVIVHRGG
ncbi:MAG: hypothetical protein DMD99_12870 [Candidatus Rokuibacteriota bacterium]|nr:MAG: hypothetical protein DMD99_12870 [Candidatus Rokubacteria bacterium]